MSHRDISRDDDGNIENWEVDGALDTLLRAEEIKRNKELMNLVGKKGKDQKKDLTKLENQLFGGEDSES